jgi:hypothetical protein
MLRDQPFEPHPARRLELVRAYLPLLEGCHEDPLGPPAQELRQVGLAQVQQETRNTTPAEVREPSPGH